METRFVPASERQQTGNNKRLSEMSKEEIVEVAKRYTRQDWHIVKGFMAEAGIQMSEEEAIQFLFNTKYKLLMAKARGKAQEDALSQVVVPD